MRRLAIVLVVVASIGAAAGCGGDGDDESQGTTTTAATGTQRERTNVTGQDTVEVAQHDFFFKPAILVGTPGQKVTIDLTNEGAAAHTFTVAEQLVDEEVQPGEAAQIRITLPKSGEVAFICRYHESDGMTGTLEASG
jgi:plastocyanin